MTSKKSFLPNAPGPEEGGRLLLFPGMGQAGFKQMANMVVIQAVIENLAFPPGLHQAAVFEPPELVACGGFANFQKSRQIAHAHGLVLQGKQHFQAGGVGYGPENACHPLNLLRQGSGFAGPFHPVNMDAANMAPVRFLVQIFFGAHFVGPLGQWQTAFRDWMQGKEFSVNRPLSPVVLRVQSLPFQRAPVWIKAIAR
jgi:hypothetical protein